MFVVIWLFPGWYHVRKLGHLEGAREAADAAVGELHDTVCQSKQGVVFANANVLARADFGAALANEDVTRDRDFAGVFLYAKTLTMRIAAITGRTTCFFVSHRS